MRSLITILFFLWTASDIRAQDSLEFSGQISGWLHVNPEIDLPINAGGRYIPALNYQIRQAEDRMIDFEASANISGAFGTHPFDTSRFNGKIKPYRIWARYSARQFEIRAGLQKINFGSASMLRPLMWFDQLDPRDPLQLTDGVWSLLFRYYFLNNANLWLWGLYGNEGPKTWETGKTSKNIPELGGRFQTPVPKGEIALSYHFRKVDTRDLGNGIPSLQSVSENRIGFDGKWDLGIGLWLEGSWIGKNRNTGMFTNQEMVNLGLDYTFGIGNGLNAIAEHLVFSYDEKAFRFDRIISFTGASLSYPLGLFDNLGAIFYYDWTNKNFYNFINWKHQFNKISFYLMAFRNPQNFVMPQQNEGAEMFSGTGVQIMLVYNH